MRPSTPKETRSLRRITWCSSPTFDWPLNHRQQQQQQQQQQPTTSPLGAYQRFTTVDRRKKKTRTNGQNWSPKKENNQTLSTLDWPERFYGPPLVEMGTCKLSRIERFRCGMPTLSRFSFRRRRWRHRRRDSQVADGKIRLWPLSGRRLPFLIAHLECCCCCCCCCCWFFCCCCFNGWRRFSFVLPDFWKWFDESQGRLSSNRFYRVLPSLALRLRLWSLGQFAEDFFFSFDDFVSVLFPFSFWLGTSSEKRLSAKNRFYLVLPSLQLRLAPFQDFISSFTGFTGFGIIVSMHTFFQYWPISGTDFAWFLIIARVLPGFTGFRMFTMISLSFLPNFPDCLMGWHQVSSGVLEGLIKSWFFDN